MLLYRAIGCGACTAIGAFTTRMRGMFYGELVSLLCFADADTAPSNI